ncbi:MAG TPA: hypothetical protein VEF76_04015 [Patescibacteria group bacterium]|nr:hypothetical protein [Patescibacteria group bacterium]
MTEPTPEQREKNQDMILQIIRGTGAVLMIAGAAMGFNLGHIAQHLGLDGNMHRLLGGAIFFAGIIDFAVLPGILDRALKDK